MCRSAKRIGAEVQLPTHLKMLSRVVPKCIVGVAVCVAQVRCVKDFANAWLPGCPQLVAKKHVCEARNPGDVCLSRTGLLMAGRVRT